MTEPQKLWLHFKTALITKYKAVFAADGEVLGETDQMVYDVNTGNAAPVAQKRYKTCRLVRWTLYNR